MTALAPWTWGRKNLPVRPEENPTYALQRSMNTLFDEFFRSFDMPFGYIDQEIGEFNPRIDVKETEKEILLSAELPGLTEKDVSVTLANDTLTITGEKKEEKEETVQGHYRMERTYGSFRRTMPLPCEVETNKVTAEFKDGILSVKLPKAPESQKKAKTIAINKA